MTGGVVIEFAVPIAWKLLGLARERDGEAREVFVRDAVRLLEVASHHAHSAPEPMRRAA